MMLKSFLGQLHFLGPNIFILTANISRTNAETFRTVIVIFRKPLKIYFSIFFFM